MNDTTGCAPGETAAGTFLVGVWRNSRPAICWSALSTAADTAEQRRIEMAIAPNQLTPYKSLLLCAIPAAVPLNLLVGQVRDQISAMIAAKPHTNQSAATTPPAQAGLRISYFDYVEQKQIAWTTAVRRDRLHQLVMVCRLRRQLAIMMTDSTLRDQVVRLLGSGDGSALGGLRPITRGLLNAAFVQGKAKTLWLSNVRPAAFSTVDSKILAGDDLQFALDPLLDQAFSFSAVRCVPPAAVFGQSIGVSPRKSSIWAGISNDFAAFCAGVAQLLQRVEAVAAAPVDDPLPCLATPLEDGTALAQVAHAFSAAVTPMELLDGDLPAPDREYAEKWSRLSFTVNALAGPHFTADIALSDNAGVLHALGRIQVNFDLATPARIRVEAQIVPGAPVHDAAELNEAVTMLNLKHLWLRVWYQSGHSLSDGGFSMARFRDQPFPYSWDNFAGFNVLREKPDPLLPANIGTQNSLFCWVQHHWWPNLIPPPAATGWLACNDGSYEMADFIYLNAPAAGAASLSLVHVKASSSGDAGRAISLGDFHIVVSQAEKNLRYLDRLRLADEFTDFLQAKLFDAVWHNGAINTRANMLAALQAAPTFPSLKVIIVQPRVTQTAVNAARAAAIGTTAYRAIHQLDTLLLAAAATCRGIGAEFQVIGDVI
jgi:hypothetical protein